MNQPIGASRAFSLTAGLAVLVALIAANIHYFFSEAGLGPLNEAIFYVTLAYLSFITLRTAILIIFSFADRFFQPEIPRSGSHPLVSILVPCYNEEVVVADAIDALLEIDYPNYEILVIDDGSTDQTLLAAKAKESKHKVRILHQKNQGKAHALNHGLSAAMGELVLSVDADSVMRPDVLRKGVPFFERDPMVAAVAGSVCIGNTHTWLGLFQRLEYISGLNLHKSAQSFLRAVNIVPGPVGLFRKSVVLAMGGYHTDTFAEDCDLTIRMLMEGWRIVYCGEMVSVTEVPEDFTSLLKQRYRWARGTIQAIKKNAAWLVRPFAAPRNFAILAYFTMETLLLPTANFLFSIAFIEHATLGSDAHLMGPFFLQLVLLNVVMATYSVCIEQEPWPLIALSAINPLTYGMGMELLRFASLMDEIIGLPMSWNKLARTGNIDGKGKKAA